MTLDFNHGSGQPAKTFRETVNNLIDEALRQRNLSEKPRKYLGASALGDPCERRLQLDYLLANEDEHCPEPDYRGFDGQTIRRFDAGHEFERLAANWIQEAGFFLVTGDDAGYQAGGETANGRIQWHIDGVIQNGPLDIAYPCLWEHKGVGNKSFSKFIRDGVKIANPVYAAQIAFYQAYMDLPNPAWFTVTNTDTKEMHHELVEFDAELAQATSDKGVRILENTDAGLLMPAVAQSGDHFQCRGCRWWGYCWGNS